VVRSALHIPIILSSTSTIAMLHTRPHVFSAPCSAPYIQVPLQKDVKVNWVRPGQVVHESQQVDYVLVFENRGAAPGAGRKKEEHSMEKEGLCIILFMSSLVIFAAQSRRRRT